MLKITAKVNTLLKKSIADSSVDNADVHNVESGKSYYVTAYSEATNNHYKVALDYQAGTWYVYAPHWLGFPSQLTSNSNEWKWDNTLKASQNIRNACLAYGVTRRGDIAYVIATAEGESNLRPIKEIRGQQLTADQQKYWHTGFYGRGFVQLTWKGNYAKASQKLGIDLVSNPDKVLEPEIATKILVIGMRDGWFTGKQLSHYNEFDYWTKRMIINPGQVLYRQYHNHNSRFVELAKKWQQYC